MTSRNLPDIERFLHSDSPGVKVSLELSASHVTTAVATYVDFKVQHLTALQKYNFETKMELQKQLHEKAEGMFLWV